MTSLTSIMTRFSDRRRSEITTDPNADYIGYRSSGDPRHDLAMTARRLQF